MESNKSLKVLLPLLLLLLLVLLACSSNQLIDESDNFEVDSQPLAEKNQSTVSPEATVVSESIEPTKVPEPTDNTEQPGALFNYMAAVNLSRAGMHEEAIPQFALVIRRLPEFAEAYYGRGVAYFEEELFSPAIEDLSQAIVIKPELADAYSARADVYIFKQEYEMAIKDLEKAISLYDDNRFPEKILDAKRRLSSLRRSETK
jgi:tetratricopeptide (TPR) repeat protein